MNDHRIKQVLEIERRAEYIHETALHDAEQLQKQAEQEAQALLEKTRVEAEAEAKRLTSEQQINDECACILTESEEESRRLETLAAQHADRAVAYVLDQLVGREQV